MLMQQRALISDDASYGEGLPCHCEALQCLQGCLEVDCVIAAVSPANHCMSCWDTCEARCSSLWLRPRAES